MGQLKATRQMIFKLEGVLRELAPLGIDLYTSCPFACSYCFSPRETPWLDQVPKGKFFSEPKWDRGQLDTLRWEYKYVDQMVLISPYTEPYPRIKDRIQLRAVALLRNFLKWGIPCAILTKAGKNVLRDIETIKKFGTKIKVGTTIITVDDHWQKYEKNAAPPYERMEMLKRMKDEGVRTFVCLMPIFNSADAIKIIDLTKDYADEYFIGCETSHGRLTNSKRLMEPHQIILERVVGKLRDSRKRFYVEERLRNKTDVFLTVEETRRGDFYVYNDGIGDL